MWHRVRVSDISPRATTATSLRLSALLAVTGILHFVVPKLFDAIVPPALPGNARSYTYASGIAELGVAGMLAIPRTRRVGGIAAALLFLAVFPANIQMAADWWRNPKIPLPMKVGALLRLPVQIPMVTEAVKVARTAA
ncbi:DoxX family protein [Nocardia uniformis]|uniref:DoxX family protein n=1 Tax=Nocardia uniformis TaxID=53432 RepID=UPI00147896B4|nr:MauE/DoxX family redox-associated membrane protein [Nocardia uniformis]